MGDFTLGCLLGQYDRAQSFDVESVGGLTSVNSWQKPLAQSSWQFNGLATDVHSSAQGIRFTVFSHGSPGQIARYIYGRSDDAHARWFPDVTTHGLRLDAWIRVRTTSNSGYSQLQLYGGPGSPVTADIGWHDPLANYRLATDIWSSGTRPQLDLVSMAHTTSYGVDLDDVLLQVDPITLHPQFEFREQARLMQSGHRTRAGKLHTYVWGKHLAYEVPLRFLPTSHADLINWWWEHQFNLAFTLDTSDSESVCVVRIVNERQPIDLRLRPYPDQWQGVLQLESLDEGTLVY